MLCSRHLSSREKNCIVMLGYVLMDKSPNSDVLGKTKLQQMFAVATSLD